MTASSDAELVLRARSGEKEAYGELVSKYQGHVYGLAYSFVNNWAEAQDIAQETFIRAYANLDQLRDPARFAAWLRRVTFGVAMSWLRTFRNDLFKRLDGRVDVDSLEIPDFRPGPAEVAQNRDLARAVLGAIDSLPAKYRVPLTMFHLDGLSYQKVADFLDIPLGTVKTLIHRARKKLEAALAAYATQEISPMVQEVFNEHKLPTEFAGNVLENIADLRWAEGECCFCGSVVACMRFLDEPVTYCFVAGVSGSAFKLLWHPDWCPGNNSLPLLGEEPIRRAFRALGYEYEYLPKSGDPNSEHLTRRQIIQSIDNRRPAIAYGVLGSPEACVIAGYERNGDVLLGRSYFHDGSRGYLRKAEWYKGCCGLILIGKKTACPDRGQIVRDALRWAVELARTPEWNGRISGLAAYEAWAGALARDADFPPGNISVLTQRCHVSNSVTLAGLWDARKAAAAFLRNIGAADDPPPGVLKAAAAYERESSLLDEAMRTVPHCHEPETKRAQMADPKLRARLADLILAAQALDRHAVEHLEAVLQRLPGN